MLVIHVDLGQGFSIGDAKVTLRKRRGKSIKVEVKAPKEVQVLRDDAKRRERKVA